MPKKGIIEEECVYLQEHNTKENVSMQTVEIFIESEFNEKRKIKSLNKKQRNEHRKTKKRKHREIEDNSSDDNLLNIKTKQELVVKKFKKDKKKKKKGSKHKNQFPDSNNIDIKQEILSENEQNMLDESDEDVPLSLLDKNTLKSTNVKSKIRKTYTISNNADIPDVEGKVKKLKIKKIKVENDDNENSCVDCDKAFEDTLKYKAHMRKVHSYKSHVCGICTKAFYREKDLENHYNTHTGQNPYCCGQCGKLFKSDGTLKKHIRIFHADNYKKYACSMCSKVLSSASCLEEHERLHTGENPWSCNLCGKLFARERDLKLHANLHEELWKCDICQRCFLTSFKLKEHYRSHTGETPYECDKCDRKFARIADYRYHMGTHLGLKPFTCELCGMKFTTSSSMKRHLMNMHQQGPLDFKCPICTKGFHTQARLNSHIKNHENKKKFACHICNATRSSQSELQRHLILHSGEFRCDTCNQSCSSAERLAAHVAKHDLTGKPYACFVCSLGYQSSQTLNKHLATVHKNEDIPKVAPQHLCTLCGMVFDHKDKLNRHLKDDHVVLAVGEIHSLVEEEQYKIGKQEIQELSERTEQDVATHHISGAKHINEFKIKINMPTKPSETNTNESDVKMIRSNTDSHHRRDTNTAKGNKNNDSLKCERVESQDDLKDTLLKPDKVDEGNNSVSEVNQHQGCRIKVNSGNNESSNDLSNKPLNILEDTRLPCIKSEIPASENYSSPQPETNRKESLVSSENYLSSQPETNRKESLVSSENYLPSQPETNRKELLLSSENYLSSQPETNRKESLVSSENYLSSQPETNRKESLVLSENYLSSQPETNRKESFVSSENYLSSQPETNRKESFVSSENYLSSQPETNRKESLVSSENYLSSQPETNRKESFVSSENYLSSQPETNRKESFVSSENYLSSQPETNRKESLVSSENYLSSQPETNRKKSLISSPSLPRNSIELIENLARKNVECFLHKQELENITCSVSGKLNNDIENEKSECEDVIEKGKEISQRVVNFNKVFSELPTTKTIQKILPESTLSQACSRKIITDKQDINTKKEIYGYPIVHTIESKERNSNSFDRGSSSLTNASTVLNYFDEFDVKDLSTSSTGYKDQKGQHKYDMCDNLYSKTPVSSVTQHSKNISQNSLKSVTDPFENFNYTQPGIQQSWFLPNKMSSGHYQQPLLKQHSTSRGYVDSKQKDAKASRVDMFQIQSNDYEHHYNNQYKTHVDSRQDNNMALFSGPPALYKDNYYDKKHSYGTGTLDPKHYFDDFACKPYAEDDRKRPSHLNNDVTNSKRNIGGHQLVDNHVTSEHSLPSSLTIPDHYNPTHQFNYYNPHTFATMANSPHLFQNFRELQHRMLSSGIPSYNHHSRQHLLSGMDVSSQRVMSNSPSSSSSVYNQHHTNTMPPIPRHTYSDISNPNDSVPVYQGNRPSPDNTDKRSGQGKDDANVPYELRVAAT